jgi:osmotically-inducible protein OsmY
VSIQDEALTGMVQNAIALDKRICGQAIAVRAAHGEVSLKGIVDEDEQRELAILVARGISGVRNVNADELRVKEAAE